MSGCLTSSPVIPTVTAAKLLPSPTATIIRRTLVAPLPATPKPTVAATATRPSALLDHLPTGQYVVYAGPNQALYVLSLAGETMGALAIGPDGSSVLSPSGQHVVYVAGVFASGYHLATLDLATLTVAEVPNSSGCLSASWSPNEEQLAATCDSQIVIIDLVNGTRTALTSAFPNGSADHWDFPAWSPDGRWLAYVNLFDFPSGSEADGIYLTDTACLAEIGTCTAQTQHPMGPALTDAIVWAPNSQRYVIHYNSSFAALGVPPMPSALWELPAVDADSALAWSPDGTLIAYSGTDGIYLAEVAQLANARRLVALSDISVVFWLDIQ